MSSLVFTTITKGRSGRLLADSNWRRQAWWPAVEAGYHSGGDGELQLVPHYPPHSMGHTCTLHRSWLLGSAGSCTAREQWIGHWHAMRPGMVR
ncbi:hypothetical protein AB0A69_26845 [Streptomyces sp. NPDC045431]|uniref:hypothetical protein n=1 Tax=Streptomyces sp. NPDC045431 TaxID=3155613 RepID=UPI0033F1F0DB